MSEPFRDEERSWSDEELAQGFRVLRCEPSKEDPKRLDITVQLIPPLSYIELLACGFSFAD